MFDRLKTYKYDLLAVAGGATFLCGVHQISPAWTWILGGAGLLAYAVLAELPRKKS